MLNRIIVKGYRALRYVDVPVAPMQVLVGPNGSGKSTFFDVLLFVRDILNHGVEAAVLGDERLLVPSRAGDPRDITWMRQGEQIEIVILADLPEALRSPDGDDSGSRFSQCRYEIAIRDDQGPKIVSDSFERLRPAGVLRQPLPRAAEPGADEPAPVLWQVPRGCRGHHPRRGPPAATGLARRSEPRRPAGHRSLGMTGAAQQGEGGDTMRATVNV